MTSDYVEMKRILKELETIPELKASTAYKNIDNMPKLEDFSLYCIKPLEDEFCKKFVHKLLHLNLKNINFTLKYKSEPDNPYSIDELKYLWPDVNFNKFNKLHIQKFY